MRIKSIFWWCLAISYLAVNYATLGSMPVYWNKINELFSGQGVLFQYILYSLTAVLIAAILYRKNFLKSVKNILITVVMVIIFCIMFYFEKNPGEKIHMFQYGVFGWLIFKSLSPDLKAISLKLVVAGCLICLAAGAIDEIIQGILPNRVFTWHDVVINGLSGVMVLVFTWYYHFDYYINQE